MAFESKPEIIMFESELGATRDGIFFVLVSIADKIFHGNGVGSLTCTRR